MRSVTQEFLPLRRTDSGAGHSPRALRFSRWCRFIELIKVEFPHIPATIRLLSGEVVMLSSISVQLQDYHLLKQLVGLGGHSLIRHSASVVHSDCGIMSRYHCWVLATSQL